MEIQWYGNSSFCLNLKNLNIYLDFPKEKVPEPEKKKQALIYSLPNSAEEGIKHKDRLIIDNPGEYEISGVEIQLLPINERNLIILKSDEGVLVDANLDILPPERILKALSETEILLLAAGKNGLVSKDASEICNKIEPKVLVPMNFQEISEIETFLKNENFVLENPLESYKFIKTELDPENRKNVLLKAKKI